MNFPVNPRVGIVGLGFVGEAIKHSLELSCDLVLVDIDTGKGPNTYQDLLTCEGIFVCVPTPLGDNGTCDTTILEDVLLKLKEFSGVIISKCTAPPLVYRELNKQYPNLVHSPEFLTAANAIRDYQNATSLILGGRVKAYLDQAEKISKWGQNRISSVLHCTIEEASLTKYTINSFLATKVVFMNEVSKLAEAIGVDYNKLTKLISQDERISASHMKVPGHDGLRGFGGHCLPKDTEAMLTFSKDAGVNMEVLSAALKKNILFRLS